MNGNSFTFSARISAGSRENKIEHDENRIIIKVTAPPVEGKANKAVIDFLSDVLSVRKKDIEIKSGLRSKNKIILIGGLDKDSFYKRLPS